MKLSLRIAWRYFFGKKTAQAINIISWISVGAVAVSTAAMIVLFSVFNGLEHTIKEMYVSFYPDLRIGLKQGKFFQLDTATRRSVATLPGIESVSYTLEDMALMTHGAEQRPVTVKGVDEAWFAIAGMDDFMLEGDASWPHRFPYTPAIIGLSIANGLSIDVDNAFSTARLFYPRSQRGFSLNPASALNSLQVKPHGLFHIQEDFDGRYVLLPLQAAARLFEKEHALSAVELKVRPDVDLNALTAELKSILGEGFVVENRYEQNKTIFMILTSEKWAVYAILLMVLLIASFNMIGSLSMLVLEKRKDITILKTMGASEQVIRRTYLLEGVFLSGGGAVIGITLGTLVCLGQRYFGWVGLPNGFVIEAYPVAFEGGDYLLVLTTALIVGLLSAIYPAWRAGRQPVYLHAA